MLLGLGVIMVSVGVALYLSGSSGYLGNSSKANSTGRGGGIGMLKLKECPRCKNGSVALDRDSYGWYEYCIQCGYMRDLTSMAESGQQQAHGIKGRREVGTVSKGK